MAPLYPPSQIPGARLPAPMGPPQAPFPTLQQPPPVATPNILEQLMQFFVEQQAGAASAAPSFPTLQPAPEPRPELQLLEELITEILGGGGAAPAAAPAPTPGVVSQPAATPAVNPFRVQMESAPDWTRTPLPRGGSLSPGQDILHGGVNTILNSPQLLQDMFKPGAASVYDFLFMPQDALNAPETPAKPGFTFTPGLPSSAPRTAPSGPAVPMPGGGGSYADRVNMIESGGNRFAQNPNSSAFGPGQFTRGTWLEFIDEVHPELREEFSEAELLDLRSDPEMSNEGTNWYAGKAVDLLDTIGAPATDTNIYLHHFLGPAGVKQILMADPLTPISEVLDAKSIEANPTVLGGDRTVQDVLDWAGAKMGEFSSSGPTRIPAPQMADYSAAKGLLEQSAPRPVDPAMLEAIQLNQMFSGMGQGIASVDAVQQGGHALMAALAGGTAQGIEAGDALGLSLNRQDETARREHLTGMAAFEQSLAELLADHANNVSATDVLNKENQRLFNEQRSNDAVQQRLEMIEASKPQVIRSGADGIMVQDANGVRLITPEEMSPIRYLETMAETIGMDSRAGRQLKYDSLLQMAATNPNGLIMFQNEIIHDLVSDGSAASVFGDTYQGAVEMATEQLETTMAANPGMLTDTALRKEQLDNAISAIILQAVSGSPDWILQAAALDHPGASMLVQGGNVDAGGI